jgi:NDP-sugar pyrophosphorylase family protein
MMAVVLAGGEGIRLRPLTYSIPKPLIPVGEKPILEEIISRLRRFGFEDIVLAVGYRWELIETYFRDGEAFGVSIQYVRESQPLGTAGALAIVRRQLAPSEALLVMNGDILTQLDYGALYRWHREQRCDLTVAVRTYEDQLPYGLVQVDQGRVTGMVEKPVQRHSVSAGIYVLQPDILCDVPDDTFIDMPFFVVELLARGKHVGAYRFDDAWLAVDRLEDLEEANRLIVEWAK